MIKLVCPNCNSHVGFNLIDPNYNGFTIWRCITCNWIFKTEREPEKLNIEFKLKWLSSQLN